MPKEVMIDGLFVDDTNHPEDYEGMCLFTDPDDFSDGVDDILPAAERPFPYKPCQKVNVRGLETASGMKPRLSESDRLNARTVLIEEN